MKRLRLILLAVTLLLPIIALAAMALQAERATSDATMFRVPIRGVDPRDILRGHYLNFDYDWDWRDPPAMPSRNSITAATLCLTAPREPAKGPQASFQSDGCLAMIDGDFRTFGRPVFRPRRGDSHALPRLYVPEDYALRIEEIARRNDVPLTVDIAVTADRRVRILGWHIDGKLPKDYFR